MMNPFELNDPKLLYKLAKDVRFGAFGSLSLLIRAYGLEISDPLNSREKVKLFKTRLSAAELLRSSYLTSGSIQAVTNSFTDLSRLFPTNTECKNFADVFLYKCEEIEALCEPPSGDCMLGVARVTQLPG